MQLLIGHTSEDTAYLVEDYPYGFRLRCSIRYWIEYKPNKGFRFVSQTTNPKKPYLVWNKPKASTYSRFGGAMYLDEQHHVQWRGLSEYSDYNEAAQFEFIYGAAVPEAGQPILKAWVKAKKEYEARRDANRTQ